ncbi:hypothetical protein SH1V18_33700 [Vallitalea longa]|uniref:Uncharacterized protein n=1 Tax=Vallitalea longa TaxID=2936439 RepID=A0A9W5YE70_9FIRM|nr:hypothetical protein [Vallitalea longa]GKX30890.1 hypothetical protein SH1V18_33700 [Vallitalea longa]
MDYISGMVILPYIESILRIGMYFAIIIFAIKGVQALNIYINRNSGR